MPRHLYKRNYEGKRQDLIQAFINDEYTPFPVMLHDDMLDCLARIVEPDLAAHFPQALRRPQKKSWRERLKTPSGLKRPKGAMVA